jgi:beta-glucosidase
VGPSEAFEVEVTVRNAGARRSRQLVQVYASRSDSRLERPTRWLAAFGHVEAAPGERATVRLRVAARALEHWDVEAGAWAVEPGSVLLSAGPSSQTLPLSSTVMIATAAQTDSGLGSTE